MLRTSLRARPGIDVFVRRISSIFTLQHIRGLAAAASPYGREISTVVTTMNTEIVPIDPSRIGTFTQSDPRHGQIVDLKFVSASNEDSERLVRAADLLRTSNVPVAFPTETVYGLGADATRSDAVQGIYKAKQRPSDNPLIVHFASLNQLQSYLASPIPAIYDSVIKQFWPGPLTILLPLPSPSPFAPEVSANLSTFGARIPRNAIALALIQLADRPIAAPSANASTKPSPTAAEHVHEDLHGRIEMILDGGPCDVGVESTVVDGLSEPPAILRPGGISLSQVRACEGWEACVIGYKDKAEGDTESKGREGPRAPGMKYRHYSPKAKVVLYEFGSKAPELKGHASIGVVRTRFWLRGGGTKSDPGAHHADIEHGILENGISTTGITINGATVTAGPGAAHGKDSKIATLETVLAQPPPRPQRLFPSTDEDKSDTEIWDVHLGAELDNIARGLFSALRELDRKNVEVIFVEGIDDRHGELAAAIMNRLRKASSVRIND